MEWYSRYKLIEEVGGWIIILAFIIFCTVLIKKDSGERK